MKALSTTCDDIGGSVIRLLINKKVAGSNTSGICKIIVFGKGCDSQTTVITSQSMSTTAYTIDLTTESSKSMRRP